MLERMSAVAGGLAAGDRLRDGAAGVRLGEVRGWSLLQVAGFAGGMVAVEAAVSTAVGGVTVPAQIGETVRSGDFNLFRTGPEQIWIVGTGEKLAIEAVLRAGVAPLAGIVTSLSHSRSRIFIEGPRVGAVLAKEMAVDLHPANLSAGRFALCGLDHIPVLLHRSGETRFEIYTPRTFALSVWQRLADSALEWGYEIARQ